MSSAANVSKRTAKPKSAMGQALRFLAKKADLIDYHASKIREHTTDVARVFGRSTGLQLATQSMTQQNKMMLADMESMPAYTPLGMGLLAGLCDPRGAAAAPAPAMALQDKPRSGPALALQRKHYPVEGVVFDLTGEDDAEEHEGHHRPAKRQRD